MGVLGIGLRTWRLGSAIFRAVNDLGFTTSPLRKIVTTFLDALSKSELGIFSTPESYTYASNCSPF